MFKGNILERRNNLHALTDDLFRFLRCGACRRLEDDCMIYAVLFSPELIQLYCWMEL